MTSLVIGDDFSIAEEKKEMIFKLIKTTQNY